MSQRRTESADGQCAATDGIASASRLRARSCGGISLLRTVEDPVFSALLMLFCGCSNSPPPADEYAVNIYGSKYAVDTYSISATGLTPPEGQLGFSYDKYVRRYKAARPLHELQGLAFLLQTHKGDTLLSTMLIEPFVCFSLPSYSAKRSDGWAVKETHQYSVTDSGELLKDNHPQADFSYSCEISSPDGRNGDALSTYQSTLARCDEPARSGTQIRAVFSDPAWSSTVSGDTCQAVYLDFSASLLGEFMFLPATNTQLSVQLAQCIGADAAGVSRIDAAIADSPCIYRNIATWVDLTGGQGAQAFPVGGSWTITTTDLASGHLEAEVDMQFAATGSWPAFSIQGHVDLPLLEMNGR